MHTSRITPHIIVTNKSFSFAVKQSSRRWGFCLCRNKSQKC